MPNRKESFTTGEYYHLYNRGNNHQLIFLDDEDRDRFVKLLYLCNSTKSINFRDDIINQKIDAFDFDRGGPIVSIGTWVLMPNHFHIFACIPLNSPRLNLGDIGGNKKDENEDDSISLFMKKLSTAYSMYINKKHDRTGELFESTFKSTCAINNNQTKYNFSYIHLNPVKLIDPLWKENGIKDIEKTLKFLNTYRWSSYHDYRGKKRPENKIISPKDFPDYFSDSKVFDEEIFEWLNFRED